MATHSVKKRKRTGTPMSAAGRGDSGKSDRPAPLPSPPRETTATADTGARKSRSPSEPRPRKSRAPRGESRERQPHGVLRRTTAGAGLLGDQRCCVACGVGDDDGGRTALWKAGGARLRCTACDGEYHPGCVDTSWPYAPKRTEPKGQGQEAAAEEEEDGEEGWLCGVCDKGLLVCKPSGDVAGPPESQSCSRPFSLEVGAESPPAAAKAAPRRQRQLQQLQQQQVGAAASHARFMDVMSSALTRLAGLSDDGERGGARGGNETAIEGDAIRETAAAVTTVMNSTSKSSGGWHRKAEHAASMTDGVLEWALRSVGGTGEEGKPRGNHDDRKGNGNHGVYARADRERSDEGGPDLRLSSLSPVGGKTRGDKYPRQRKAGDVVPGGEGEGSPNNGYGSGSGDSDSGNPVDCLSSGGCGDGDSGSGHTWRSTSSLPSLGERAAKEGGMVRSRGQGSLENFGDVDIDGGGGGGDWMEEGVKSEDDTDEGDGRKEPGFWEKDGNTRFLQGVTKHGDAWARLARRHAESGVVEVTVDASDHDDADGCDYDDYGDYDDAGYSCGSGEDWAWGLGDAPRTRACSATMGGVDGVEGEEYRDKQRRRAVTSPAERKRGRREKEQEQHQRQEWRRRDAATSTGEPKSKKRRKRPSRVKERKRRRDRLWDEEEHARFVEGFKKYGNAWVDVARVVGTRDEGEVERHGARWVDRSGKQLRDEASAIRTGDWDADEQARFLEGLEQYGRSWPNIARVVRTRTSRQTRAHAQYLFEKEDRVANRVLQRIIAAANAAPTAANSAHGHQIQTAPDTFSAPAHRGSAAEGLRAGTVAAAAESCAPPNRAPRRKAAAEAITRLQSTADPEDAGSDGDASDDDGSGDDAAASDDDGIGVDDEDEDADTDQESTLSLSSSCVAPEAAGSGAPGSVGSERKSEITAGGGGGRRRGREGKRRPRSLSGEETRRWDAGDLSGSSEGERGFGTGNGKTAGSEQKSERKKKQGRNRYRYWDQDEHERFLEAHAKYGNSWLSVARAVGTRTRLQVCNHAQRVFKRRKSSGEVDSEKEE